METEAELLEQQRQFETGYPHDRHFWLAKTPEGSYKNADTQDAWLLFLKGWRAAKAWCAALASITRIESA